MKKITKRIIALVVVAALIVGTFAGISIHKKNEQKRIENTYYQVDFDVTANAAEGSERITLPDTELVKNGTIVGALPQPEKEGAVFTGWYYDSKCEKMALSNDAIGGNVTLYADFEDGSNLENRFKINYMSEQGVADDFSVEIEIIGDEDINGIKDFLKVTDISEGDVEVGFTLKEAPDAQNRVILCPEGFWKHGDLFQVEILSTSKARYVRDGQLSGEDVVYYNFTVKREEVNNLKVNSDVIFLDVNETEGVDIKEGLYNLVAGLNDDTEAKKDVQGVMKYAGELSADSTVAVYDGILHEDGTVDGEVFYIHITSKNSDGSYNYESVEFADVMFVPDVIPIPFTGNYEDGTVTVDKSLLSFDKDVYKQFNLSSDTKVEAGDYIVLFGGSLDAMNSAQLVGYGLVTGVAEKGNQVTISYTEADEKDILYSFQMYTVDNNVEVPLSETEIAALEEEFVREARANKFDEEAMDYVEQLIYSDELDEEQFSQAITRLTFEDETGHNYSLEDIRLLADDDKFYEIPDAPTIKAVVSPKLEHFEGKTGIRVEVSASFSIKIKLNSTAKGQNELEIKVVAALEQEVTLGVSVSADADWDWILFIPVLQGVDVKVSFTAGTYTGIGASLAVTTSVDDDESEWKKLVEANNKINSNSGDKKDSKSMKNTLSALKDTFKTVQNGVGGSKEGKKELEEVKDKKEDQFESNGGIGGDLPDKYSGMLSNDAEYIDIVNQELFKIAASPDPFHIIEFSLGVNFVVGIKVNCMMGWGISYANAKEYCFMIHINVFGDKASTCTSSNADLETPNFRADFYVFGNVGARAGIRLDARVGVLSTSLNSIGIVAEAGIYWEIYGFLYVYYSWESGEGSEMGAMGSMLFEIGVYLKIDFCARLIGPNLNKSISIYDHKWPLLDLGATEVPLEFDDVDKSHLNLEFPMATAEGTDAEGSAADSGTMNAKVAMSNTLAIPSDVFKVKLMSLKDGKVASVNKDSAELGSEAYSFVQNGLTCVQYNEKNFNVRCVDLTGAGGKAADTHQVRYLPATNEIYVKPNTGVSELWGQVILTYKDNTFGFNTNSISRTINVHWKGSATSAEVQYYLRDEDGNSQLFKIGDFDGFDGIEYDIIFDEDFFNQVPGCTLVDVGFDDEDKLEDMYHQYSDNFAKLEKTFNDEHKLVGDHTYTVTREELEKARSQSAAAKNAYFNFQNDRKKVMQDKKGTLTFLMCSDNTVVRLYFMKVYKTATFILNPYVAMTDAEGRQYYNSDFDSTEIVLKDSNISEAMPVYCLEYADSHSNHTINWYYYEYDMDEIRHPLSPEEILNNEDKWLPFTEDIVMPEADVVVFGLEEHWREYELTWYDGNDEAVGTMTLQANSDFIPTDLEISEESCEGRILIGWRTDDGILVNEKTLMPMRDVSLYPEFEYEKYTMHIDWEGPNGHVDNIEEVAYGSSIAEALTWYNENWCTEEIMAGRTYGWFMEGDSEDELIPVDETLTMPARDVHIIGRFENNEYTLTIEDGTKKTTETHKYEEKIKLPVKKDSEGYEVGWILDNGTRVKDSFTMPGKDTTVKADYHTHAWKLVNEKIANCTEEGVKEYTCTICGAEKKETSPIDPSNHVILGASFVQSYANCQHGTISVYECQNCDYKETKDDGVKNTNKHRTEIRGSKNASCKDAGYTGDAYCLDCGNLVSYGNTIPATGQHNYVYTRTITEATVSSDGLEEVECTVCHQKDTRVVPKLTGITYTVVFHNDYDSSTDTRTYVSGTNGSLPSDLFNNANYISDGYQDDDGHAFRDGVSVVWDKNAPGSEGMSVYLPDLDADGDRVIDLTVIHTLKMYWISVMSSNGVDYYDEYYSISMVEAMGESNAYSSFCAQTENLKGLGYIPSNITGWSLSIGGNPIGSFPLASQVDYGALIILYAITE